MTSSEVTRPRPTAPPVYRDGPSKMSEVDARSWSIDDVLDAVFFAIAAVATLWLAWLLIGSGWHLDPVLVVNSLLFWAVLAYLALPRLHQVLTWLYVPDYFIGRTRTPDGLLGDPVNLAVKGDEEDIHEAMIAAGWVRADPITLRSSWRIIVSSLLRRSYPAAPVSNLMLFGRKQSFAYQKEVEGNPAQRHHIRFWYCPPGWSLPGGGHVDWVFLVLTGYGVLQLLFLLRLVPWVLKAGYTMSLWGFSFGLGAMAGTGMHLVAVSQLVQLGWVLWILGTVLIAALWAGMLMLAIRGRLFF